MTIGTNGKMKIVKARDHKPPTDTLKLEFPSKLSSVTRFGEILPL